MNSFFRFIRINSSKLYLVLLFIITAIFTVYLFPNHGKFRYEYQKGAPWKHEDLIAPFDVAIRKSDDDLKKQRDSILHDYKPYFKYNDSLKIQGFNEFQSEFVARYAEASKGLQIVRRPKSDTLSTFVQNYCLQLLDNVYRVGVIDFNDALDKIKTGNSVVLIKDNLAENRNVSDIFTQKLAYNYINNKLNVDFTGNIEMIHLIKNLKIYDFIHQNLEFDDLASVREQNDLINNISLTRGMVQQGERIISRGDLVKEETYRILESLRLEYESVLGSGSNFIWLILGRILIVVVAFMVLFLFLLNFRPEILQSKLKTHFILLMVLLMIVPVALIARFNLFSIYLVPMVALPIILQTFYDSRIAIFIHTITIMTTAIFAPNGYEYVFLHYMAGAIAVFSLRQTRARGQLFFAVAMVFITYSATYTAFSLIQEGDFSKINYVAYGWFAINCLLLLTTYPLIFIFEKLFGFLSDITLLELSDTNHPALRLLAEKAPGTFQHVMQVANLAEDAARKIGGNPLLMRVGALYHDIGKTGAPTFFVENQVGGISPHDGLPYPKSAQMIIQHVIHGMELARKYKIPKPVADFIVTHHGTGLVKYFYTKQVNEVGAEMANIADFSYPGPPPFTKETAVLMMADAVEASARTLKEYSEDSIDKLVERIVGSQVEDNQFSDAEITFKELSIVKQALKEKLLSIYHARIEYPELKK